MKTVYILRGVQGSGKSTFIEENGLKANALSLDTFREIYAGLEYSDEHDVSLTPKYNEFVVHRFFESLDHRLKLGADLFIDNLNLRNQDIKKLRELAERFKYKCKIIDFGLKDFDFYLERNKQRPDYKKIPYNSLKKTYELYKETEGQAKEIGFEIISPEDAEKEINISIDNTIVDLSNYKKIHHIGDLQGTFTPLKNYFSKNGGLKEDEFYIFVGDFVDRGIENDQVILWLYNEAINKENVVLLKGNHEKHIVNFAYKYQKPVSNEFIYKTIPQLKRAGVTNEQLQEISDNLLTFFCYSYDEKKVIVTHGGIADIIKRPSLLNEDEFLYGFGGYGFDIDKKFTENQMKKGNKDWYQVHGHRSHKERIIDLNLNSYSLESGVEFNGYLSCLQLDKDGFKPIHIPSNVYRKELIEKAEENMFVKRKYENLEKFISQKLNAEKSNLEILEELRSNELIKEKEFGHVSSFNFTRKAFWSKSFENELVSTSRGLFVNNKTGEIIARGYDKFFNIDERGVQISKMDNIEEHTKAPYHCFEKENGYLGIMGYDSETDSLFTASKSTPEGEFAVWFREILNETVGENRLLSIKMDLKKLNACAVFEVNDPINDPHIVEYDKKHVVLLDVIKRDYEFTKMDYEHLKKIGEKWGVAVKNKGPVFPNFEAFKGFYNAVTSEDPFTTKKKLEGYVVEDKNGNMNKIKLPFYNFWKEMRGLKDKVVSSIKKEKNYDIEQLIENRPLLVNHKKQAFDFINWALNNKKIEDLEKGNIIALRNEYLVSENPKLNNEGEKKRNRLKL